MKQSKKNNAVSIIVSILLLVLFISLAAVLVKQFLPNTGGVTVITVNGKSYKDGDSIGNIDSGSEIKVVGVGNYKVKIIAYRAEKAEDFIYKEEQESRSWKDAAKEKKDFTKGFEIEAKENSVLSDGFVLKFGTLQEIFKQTCNGELSDGNYPEGDIFQLTIEANNTLSVTFGINSMVEGIHLYPDHVVF